MAKFLCLFFLLFTLSFSLQAFARESQFFSKVTRNRDEPTVTTATTTTATNPNTYFNTKDDEFVHLNKQETQEQEQQQPAFIPQTTETGGGYGLYGHDTGLNPPSTTTATTKYDNFYNNKNYDENNKYSNFNNNNENNKYNSFDDNNNNYNENSKYLSFDNNKNNKYDNFDNNRYDESSFNFDNNNNNNNNYENFNENHGKNYAQELKGLSGNSKYMNNNNNYGESKYYGAEYNGGVQKQGMSDTRFLENGRYFYDINAEKNNYNNNYMPYNNNYNTNGYYNNNQMNGNGMNQVQEEDEFDFDQP